MQTLNITNIKNLVKVKQIVGNIYSDNIKKIKNNINDSDIVQLRRG